MNSKKNTEQNERWTVQQVLTATGLSTREMQHLALSPTFPLSVRTRHPGQLGITTTWPANEILEWAAKHLPRDTTPIFCKDCKFCSNPHAESPRCAAPAAATVDLVRGYLTPSCKNERSLGHTCGINADLFAPSAEWYAKKLFTQTTSLPQPASPPPLPDQEA